MEPELSYTSSVEGTAAPLACPQGRFSNSSGLRAPEECTPCLGGFYCQSIGITEPNGPCSGGYGFLIYKTYVIISVYYELNGWCVVFLLQILLCQGSCRTHSQ